MTSSRFEGRLPTYIVGEPEWDIVVARTGGRVVGRGKGGRGVVSPPDEKKNVGWRKWPTSEEMPICKTKKNHSSKKSDKNGS